MSANGDLEGTQPSVLLDSLPYYDNDLERDASLKERAEKLIQKELKQQPQTLHPRVPPPPTLFAVRARSLVLCTAEHVSYRYSRIIPCSRLSWLA